MRLFVAVNLPPDLRRALWDAAEPLRRRGYPVRWGGPDSLHVTLKFLGETDAAREAEIRRGIDAAVEGARRFTLSIEGFGVFPSASRPRVIWAGCGAAPPLEILQHRLEQEMERLGFPLEGRAFRPHITLGRAKNDASPSRLAGLAEQLKDLEYDAVTVVESVDLMESRLSPAGATYTRRHAAALVA
ncbi:MAG TPA: RNA 2',3'-cyclic phosphodiesterase [Gemmatimonadales bacterium]|nr:RNA 2',3'-cyclic phosphodiesterase [Gemmatimonadales bacterium]